MLDRSVLDEVRGAIEPLDGALAAATAERLARAGASVSELGPVAALAVRLAAIRRSARPPVGRKVLVVAAAGGAPGDTPPPAPGVGGTVPCGYDVAAAVTALLGGATPVNALARATGASLVVVDAGIHGLDPPAGLVSLRAGDGAGDPAVGAAMSVEQALVALQAGIALVLSLASEGLDVLALGALPPGGVAAEALAAALGGPPATTAAARAALARHAREAAAGDPGADPAADADPVAALASLGGLEHGLLAGACLAAAAIRVPVIVAGPAAVAARLAAALAPAATDQAIEAGDLLVLGADAGDGSGAALALPLVDAAARLLADLR